MENPRKRLLVADDREDVANSIKEMLSPIYEVDIANSGSEVIQQCLLNQYYGLLIDVRFEDGMSGVEAAAIVRLHNKEIKIIIFSGYELSDSITRQIVEMGAQFMEKPLVLEAVQKKMGE